MTLCKSERQRCFIRFLYSTGCRVAELASIKLSACTILLGTVYISIVGKGRKERQLRVPLGLYNAIVETFGGKRYLFETSKGNPYPRQYISNEIKKITKRATGKGLSAHKMRHSWATRQLANGTPIDAVSRYLGHSDTTITLKFYAHNEMTDAQLFDEEL